MDTITTLLTDPISFAYGICVGAVIATVLCVLATYIDYYRRYHNSNLTYYETFDWDYIYKIPVYHGHSFEIVLPEVAI